MLLGVVETGKLFTHSTCLFSEVLIV